MIVEIKKDFFSPFCSDFNLKIEGGFINPKNFKFEFLKNKWFVFENLNIDEFCWKKILNIPNFPSDFYRMEHPFFYKNPKYYRISNADYLDLYKLVEWTTLDSSIIWNSCGFFLINNFTDIVTLSEMQGLGSIFNTDSVEKAFFESRSIFHGQEIHASEESLNYMKSLMECTWNEG